MLALPLLLGVAATVPSPWHLLLGIAALAGYLAAATAQAWLRARRRSSFVPSLVIFGGLFTVAGLILLVAFPALALSAVVVVPAAALVVRGARPGTPRDLANSLAQTAIALVLVPAAACVSGAWETEAVVGATLVAAGYLVGTVLVVRSVIRERGNRGFVALSVGFHAASWSSRWSRSRGPTPPARRASWPAPSPCRSWSAAARGRRARCVRSRSGSWRWWPRRSS